MNIEYETPMNPGIEEIQSNTAQEATVMTTDSSCCSETMADAKEVTLDVGEHVTIQCPEGVAWRKFTVTKTGNYTMYTHSDLDTVGRLYDCTGTLVNASDNAAGDTDFVMNTTLFEGCTYYLRMSLANNCCGSFWLMVGTCIESITVSKSAIAIAKEAYYDLSATISPAVASNHTVVWSSDDESIAVVNQASGLVFGREIGTATIYARAKENPSKFATCVVTVGKAVESIVLDYTTLTMDIGEEKQLTAIVSPNDAIVKTVEWISDNPAVATVTSSGVVTAIAPGSAKIYANACDGSGVHGRCDVTCNIPDGIQSGTDSIGVFQNISMLSTTPEGSETTAPVIKGVQFKELQNGKYSIRFVSQIKDRNYKTLGHEIHSKFGDDAPVPHDLRATVVYSELNAAGEKVYPDEGFNYFVVGVIENIPENTVASFKIVPYATTSDGTNVRGKTTLFSCKDAQPIYYCYISGKTDDSKVISYQNALDGDLTGDRSNRANVCTEQFTKSAKQIWRITAISSEVDGHIKAYYDEEYGFNANRRTDGYFNCDLIKVAGNPDANVRFLNQGNGYYKIQLAQYSDYYLTLESNSNDVRWRNTDQGDRQLWKLNMVDWEQYENEHKEYHLLCNGDTSKALRVGTRNVLRIDTPLPVRGERLSYWNRQKWTIKGEGTQMRLCSQLNNEYFLCNDGAGNAHVSNNASNSNSHLTIEPYGNTGKYTIKLSGSNLYLTLVYGEYVQDGKTYYAEWGKWSALNTADPSAQLWELKKQPTINQQGVDLGAPISDTTARILKKNGIKFVCRYYATRDMVDNVEKILTVAEVMRLHNQGFNIVSIYEDGGKTFSTTRGMSDATEALRLASTLEQPKGSVIYFAVEPEHSDQVSSIEDYFRAVKETFLTDGRYKVGVYGLAKVCNNIKDTLGYAEYSWIGQSTYASVLSIEGDADYIAYDRQQKYNIKQSEPVIYNEVEFDSDTTIEADYGQW